MEVSDKVSKDNDKKTPSLWWTGALIKVFVDAMVEEAQWSTADGGFKPQSWNKLEACVTTDAASELVLRYTCSDGIYWCYMWQMWQMWQM